MKTLEQVIEWLKTPDHIRTVLVEVEDVEVAGQPATFYMSTKPFITAPPLSRAYIPCILGGISFNENMSLDGSVNVGYGDIEIDNFSTEKDSWLDYIWVNRNVKIFIGDPRWSREDFRLIFSGSIADIASRDRTKLNLVVVDKLQKIDNPISESVITSPDSDSEITIPVTIGECFNVTPIVTNSTPNVLEYQVSNSPIEDIIEVRDNGVPVSFTKYLSEGKFRLNQSPYGEITCSVQGYKGPNGYLNTVASTVKEILQLSGRPDTRLSSAEIDLASFAVLESQHPQPVGYYCQNQDSRLEVCNLLASSLGLQLSVNSQGLVKLVKLALPTGATQWSITPTDILEKSLQIYEKPPVVATTKLGYCRNWTPQSGSLAAGVPPGSQELFKEEWLYATTVNGTCASKYRLPVEADEEEATALLHSQHAIPEAQRRNNIWSNVRYIYRFVGRPHLMLVELADTMTITNSRFGLLNGKAGLVVDISRDWVTGVVEIGVLI